jgi:hypothetical protein
MESQSRKLKSWWIVLGIVLLLTAVVVPFVHQVRLAASIQNAVEVSDEITLNDSSADSVPGFIGNVIYKSVDWYGDWTHASDHERKLYRHRLMMPFRGGQLRNLEIYDPGDFDGRLCIIIERCRALRSVTILDWGGGAVPPTPPESSWRSLCEALRTLPRLETLGIGSEQLTDDALAPLAGHPTLRKISMERVSISITPDAARIFASMPNLKELSLGEPSRGTEEIWTKDAMARFRAALPGVKVTFAGEAP